MTWFASLRRSSVGRDVGCNGVGANYEVVCSDVVCYHTYSLRVSPSGTAVASQATIRGFESRHPLQSIMWGSPSEAPLFCVRRRIPGFRVQNSAQIKFQEILNSKGCKTKQGHLPAKVQKTGKLLSASGENTCKTHSYNGQSREGWETRRRLLSHVLLCRAVLSCSGRNLHDPGP